MQITIRTEVIGDDSLKETIRTANSACQDCIEIGFKEKTFNKSKLHVLTYRKVRTQYPKLNSSIVTAVRDQASDMLKRLKNKRKPTKKYDGAIRLNHNTFKVFFDSKQVSLSTIDGRRKYQIKIPDYVFKRYILGKTVAATMGIRKKRIFLNIVVDIPNIPTKKVHKGILGIDRGIYNPVVTSHGQFFSSRKLREIKGKYRYLRANLQRAGTRAAKRHLQILAGRERRFVTDTNHCISRSVVDLPYDTFALEELNVAAMRMRKKRGSGKKCMKLLGNWSPRQLLTFIQYKAELQGKSILLVNSHYTSQCCNLCGNINRKNRNKFQFRCTLCGYTLHSDLNAARNIAALAKGKSGRLSVNQPIVTHDELKASLRDELRASVVASSASQMRGS